MASIGCVTNKDSNGLCMDMAVVVNGQTSDLIICIAAEIKRVAWAAGIPEDAILKQIAIEMGNPELRSMAEDAPGDLWHEFVEDAAGL